MDINNARLSVRSKFGKGSKEFGRFYQGERDNQMDPFCRVNVCMHIDYKDNGAARQITTPSNCS